MTRTLEEGSVDRQGHAGRRPGGVEGRDSRGASTGWSPGLLAATSSCSRGEGGLPLGASRGTSQAHTTSGLSASRLQEITSCHLSCPVCVLCHSSPRKLTQRQDGLTNLRGLPAGRTGKTPGMSQADRPLTLRQALPPEPRPPMSWPVRGRGGARSSALLITVTLSKCPESLSDCPLQPMNLIVILFQALGRAPGTGQRPTNCRWIAASTFFLGETGPAVKDAAFLISV